MHNKKVFVTGLTGLIGKETVPFLREHGFEIYGLTTQSYKDTADVTYCKASLFDTAAIRKMMQQIKPSHLLHFAWLTTGRFNDNSNFDFLTSSINLLNAFGESGGKRTVMAGTFLEYGHSANNLHETRGPLQPIHIYGKCKAYLRDIAQLYCENNDISFAWGRIFSAFGKESDPRRLTADILNGLYANKEVVIRSGCLLRDYIYSKDAAGAFTALLDSDVGGPVNICTGIETSIHDYAMSIAKMLGKEHLLKFEDNPGNQQHRVVGDCHRLTDEVGFQPKYTLHDALKEFV